MTTRENLLILQMGSDERVPRSALGYASDLSGPNLSPAVRADRLAMLSRYVPDLVRDISEASAKGE